MKVKFTRNITTYLEIEAKSKKEAIHKLNNHYTKDFEIDWNGEITDEEGNIVCEIK